MLTKGYMYMYIMSVDIFYFSAFQKPDPLIMHVVLILPHPTLAVTDSSIGMTALFLAVQESNDEIVDILLEVSRRIIPPVSASF